MTKTRITLALVAASAAAFTISLSPASATSGAASTGTAQLTQKLAAQGGQLSADGRWMRMPGGVDVSMSPAVFGDCPSGWVCLWQDGGYSGRMLKWSSSGTSIAHLSDYGFNDEMSSWANRGSHLARWWTDADFNGTHHDMPAGSTAAHGGGDTASSLKIY
ncbi:peptidase inhibitor family I36 protein [Kribbella monticola]|uniref:peptidase inhibitor family I36 protein n=1 Tax=Kribbella monticola TaxID=2185285 RepID=UPI000DD2C11A|nr:peptidase inhibitor family I36 protein [Kribbella monticola]